VGGFSGPTLAAGTESIDQVPRNRLLSSASSFAQATGAARTGSNLTLTGGLGTRFYTVVNFALGAGDTLTINVDGTATVLTEGVEFTAAVSNNATATSIEGAINLAFTTLTALAVGAVVFVTKSRSIAKFTVASGDATFTTATNFVDGSVLIPGRGDDSVAIGPGATASGADDTALGNGCTASAGNCTAVGDNCTASAVNSLAIGQTCLSSGGASVAAGSSCTASGASAIAIGNNSAADSIASIAIGDVAAASNTNAIAIGDLAVASGSASIALGENTDATNVGSVAIGSSADAINNFAIAIGEGSTASGHTSVAIGATATADQTTSIAIGSSADVAGTSAIAIGTGPDAGAAGVAIGETANATGTGIAIGSTSIAASDAVAIGDNAEATFTSSIAIGADATANFLDSLAIGENATVTAANQAVFGGTTSFYSQFNVVQGANAEQTQIRANTTSSVVSGATHTFSGLIPAGSLLLGVTSRVTTLITGATSFDVGDGTDASAFGSAIAVAAGTTTNLADSNLTAVPIYSTASDVVLTANGSNFTAGVVRITVHYISLTAATS